MATHKYENLQGMELENSEIDVELPSSKVQCVNASCFCLNVDCTCIHLNGNFNKVIIQKVLPLSHNKFMCDPGPSTSTHCVKRRKLLTSESSEEKLKISESKKICKVTKTTLDSDDSLVSEANETSLIPITGSNNGTMNTGNLNSVSLDDSIFNNVLNVSSSSTTSSVSSMSSLSSSSAASSRINNDSPSSTSSLSSSSPALSRVNNVANENAIPVSLQSGGLLTLFNFLHSQQRDSDHSREGNQDIFDGDADDDDDDVDDDDDDIWFADSLDSADFMSDGTDKVPNPEVLNKPAPKPNWCPVLEVNQRQYGGHSKYQSQVLFQQRYYSSLHAAERFELMYKMEQHRGCVNALDFHPGGSLLASASDDRKVIIWDWAQGRSLYSYKSGHTSNVFQSKWLNLAGVGYVVSSARDGMIRLADLTKVGEATPTTLMAQHKRSAHKLSVIRDTPHVVLSAGEDGRVLKVDMRETSSANSKKFLVARGTRGTLPLYSVACNPLNSNEFIVAGKDTKVLLYDRRFIVTKSSKPLKMFCPSTIHKGVHYITCAVYNYAGTEILASYNDEKIYLFDNTVETSIGSTVETYLHSYDGHRNIATVKGVNFFGPKSEYILSGSDDGHIYIWDKKTEAIVNWMRGDDNGVVNSIEAHPNFPVIASSGLDDNVKIWVPSSDLPPTFKGLKKTILMNEKKRTLIESIPSNAHLQWVWQNLVMNQLNDDSDTERGDN